MYKERMEELKRVELGMKEVGEIAIAIVEENNHVPEITSDFEAFEESAPFFADFIEQVKKYYKIEAQTRLLATKTIALRPSLTITTGEKVSTAWRKMFVRVKEMEVQRPSVHSCSAEKRLKLMVEVLEDLLLRLELDGRPVEHTTLLIARFRDLSGSLLSNLSDFYHKLAERGGKIQQEYIQNCERDVKAFTDFAVACLQDNFKAFSLSKSDMERYKKMITGHGDMLLNAVVNATLFYEKVSALSEKMKLIEIDLNHIFAVTDQKFVVITPTVANAARGVVERNERLKTADKTKRDYKPDKLKQLEERVDKFIENINPIIDKKLSEYKEVVIKGQSPRKEGDEQPIPMTGRSFSCAHLLKAPRVEAGTVNYEREFLAIAEKAIQMTRVLDFQKVEIGMKDAELSEKQNEIYRLKAQLLRLNQELEAATAKNLSDVKSLESLKMQLKAKDEEISELKQREDATPLREGIITIGTQYARKYRTTFSDTDKLTNEKLIDKVGTMIREGPSMDQGVSDITATVSTELKRILDEDIETDSVDELLRRTDTMVMQLKNSNRQFRDRLRKFASALSEALILGRREPSPNIPDNLQTLKDLIQHLTHENEHSEAKIRDIRRQNKLNWYVYCANVLGSTSLTHDMTEDDLISLASSEVQALKSRPH